MAERELFGRQQFPEATLSVNLSLSFLPFPTTLCLATHESAALAIDGPKMTNSTTLGLVTSLKMMMMVVGVLNFAVPQSPPPSEILAILRIFGVQDPVCCFDESLISMQYKVLLVLQHTEWPARPGPSHPLASPFRPGWAPLGGLGARNFDAGARFRAPLLVWASLFWWSK